MEAEEPNLDCNSLCCIRLLKVYVLRPYSGAYIGTFGPKYLLFGYMDVKGSAGRSPRRIHHHFACTLARKHEACRPFLLPRTTAPMRSETHM